MTVSWTRTVDPVEEPVTVAEAKKHCRALADVTDEDSIVESYIVAAREIGEGYTGRGWMTQTWKFVASEWADNFLLPMAAPLQSVSSVKYYDANGVLQTLATSYYTVDTASTPGRLCRAANQAWPTLQAERTAPRVEVTYVVGWTSVENIPAKFKVGLLLLVDHLYENRSAVQVGVGIGAVELPLGLSTFFGDRAYWWPPVCA